MLNGSFKSFGCSSSCCSSGHRLLCPPQADKSTSRSAGRDRGAPRGGRPAANAASPAPAGQPANRRPPPWLTAPLPAHRALIARARAGGLTPGPGAAVERLQLCEHKAAQTPFPMHNGCPGRWGKAPAVLLTALPRNRGRLSDAGGGSARPTGHRPRSSRANQRNAHPVVSKPGPRALDPDPLAKLKTQCFRFRNTSLRTILVLS